MSEQPWREDNHLALENELPRLDVVEKVTGKARYTTDRYPQNLIWAGYIRCPFGQARLRSAEVNEAQQVAGVLEVRMTKRRGRYHGDRLGFVCAESRQALEEAMAALDMQFETQDPVTTAEQAKTPLDRIATPDNLDQALFVSEELPQTKRVMVMDEDLCVHCGLCAERCPTGAWDMQKSELLIPYAVDEAIETRSKPTAA